MPLRSSRLGIVDEGSSSTASAGQPSQPHVTVREAGHENRPARTASRSTSPVTRSRTAAASSGSIRTSGILWVSGASASTDGDRLRTAVPWVPECLATTRDARSGTSSATTVSSASGASIAPGDYRRQADVAGLANVDDRVAPRGTADTAPARIGSCPHPAGLECAGDGYDLPSGGVSKPRRASVARQLGRDLRRFLVGESDAPRSLPNHRTDAVLREDRPSEPPRRDVDCTTRPASRSRRPRCSGSVFPLPQRRPPVSLCGAAHRLRRTWNRRPLRTNLPPSRNVRCGIGFVTSSLSFAGSPALTGLELPARIGVAEPAILRRRPGRPPVASGVGRVGVRVDGSIDTAATGGLSAEQFPHQVVQVGVVELSDAARRNLQRTPIDTRSVHGVQIVPHERRLDSPRETDGEPAIAGRGSAETSPLPP